MSNPFFDHPILNSPYEIPARHWELDEQGQQVSFMTLLGGFNGLQDTIPRAEGVAMDDKGNLYMVSEPALFYRFSKN